MYKINILAHTFEKSGGVCYQTQLDAEAQINSNLVSYFPHIDYTFLLIFIFSLIHGMFFSTHHGPKPPADSNLHPFFLTTINDRK